MTFGFQDLRASHMDIANGADKSSSHWQAPVLHLLAADARYPCSCVLAAVSQSCCPESPPCARARVQTNRNNVPADKVVGIAAIGQAVQTSEMAPLSELSDSCVGRSHEYHLMAWASLPGLSRASNLCFDRQKLSVTFLASTATSSHRDMCVCVCVRFPISVLVV